MTNKRDTSGCVCNFDTFKDQFVVPKKKKDQFDSWLHFQEPNADAC